MLNYPFHLKQSMLNPEAVLIDSHNCKIDFFLTFLFACQRDISKCCEEICTASVKSKTSIFSFVEIRSAVLTYTEIDNSRHITFVAVNYLQKVHL
jgi:hypothetical protein